MLNSGDYAGLTYWAWPNITPEERVPVSTAEELKTLEKYDLPNARHYMGRNYGEQYDFLRACTCVNEAFTTGRMFGLRSDYNSFLMDQGVTNTRQPFVFPLTQTMNTRLLGQLSKISIEAKMEAVTQRATSRRELDIMRALAFSQAAQTGPEVANVMQTKRGVGSDSDEATKFADKTFQDPLVKAGNAFLTMMSVRNKYPEMRKHVGQNVNTSGMGIAHAFVNGSDYWWEVIDSKYAFYDVNSKKPDMSDGAFCGFFKFWTSVSALAEAFNLSKEKVQKIEDAVRTFAPTVGNGSPNWPAGCPVTATCYYKDGKYIKRGFIEGPNGPQLVSVDTINPDTGKAFYTEADLIDPPEYEYTAKWKGKTDTRFYEVLRYCVFIPKELMPIKNGDLRDDERAGDFAIAGGEYELQECDPEHEYSVKMPLKMGTWMNVGGYVVAPLTAVMSPQRIVSQITSDIMWRMSQASAQVPFFDKKALSSGGLTAKAALTAYKRGNPMYGDTVHIGGAQNAVQMVGGGLDPNIFKQWELLHGFIRMAEDSMGLYAQNSGAPGPANQLVGVKEIQQQQQDGMSRPYFACNQSVFEQMHQFDAQAGRQFYIKRRWRLEDLVGKKNADVLAATKYADIEQFRVTTVLSLDPAALKMEARTLILGEGGLLDRQLLDVVTAARLMAEGAYPEDLWPASEQFTQERAIAQEAAAEAQAKAAQMQMLQGKEQQLAEEERELYGKAMEMAVKTDATNMKGTLPMMSAQAKATVPQPAVTA